MENEQVEPRIAPIPPKVHERRHDSVRIFFGAFLRTIAVGSGLLVFIVLSIFITSLSEKSQCNVAVRTLHGEVATYSYDGFAVDSGALVRALGRDEKDSRIKGIILDIDSSGGSPVAGEEIADELARLNKPNAAVIRGVGASAAYWAATGADQIYASRSSDVGSIGVIVSFPDESEKNKQEGVSYNEFATGKFKNLGTPTRPVTKEEKALLEEGINDVFEHFISFVAAARHMDIEKVRALADGSTVTGVKAKEKGLIDAIGGIEEARVYLSGKIGEEAVLCEPDAEELF